MNALIIGNLCLPLCLLKLLLLLLEVVLKALGSTLGLTSSFEQVYLECVEVVILLWPPELCQPHETENSMPVSLM